MGSDEIVMDGVTEYRDDLDVRLVTNGERLTIKALNEAGFASTEVDLLQLLGWVRNNRPELLRERSVAQDISDVIAVKLAKRKDFIISKAVSKHIGHDEWTFDGIISRLSSCAIGGKEVWVMDGTNIAEFMPVDVSLQDGFIGAKISYRILV